ncbi:geranylgeranyl reductase family protein [Caldiplasma sukawensis]
MYDFVVIGAGPSGSMCAYYLSRKGYSVLQLEENESVGKPVECTGLVSERVIKITNTHSVINTVRGAHIHFPDSSSISVKKDEKTYVLERDRFDQDVAAMAIGAGTELSLNSRVSDIRVNRETVEVTFRKEGNIKSVKSKAVVGADGANSITRKVLFPGLRYSRIVSAYQVDSIKRMEDQDNVNVYLGSQYSKGYFAWATPAGDFSRIGTAGFGLSREKFITLWKRMGEPSNATITGGPIPISTLNPTYRDRALLVGDAGGIVKPLSGGGIYTGMLSGIKAAETLSEAYESENFSEESMKNYEKAWKKEIGKELRRDLRIQKIYSKITDTSFNEIGRKLQSERIKKIIENIGDIDYPSRVVFSILIRKPSIARHVLFPVK